MSDATSDRNPVEELAEEFLARFRRGERPALSEYVSRYPELAAEIRDLFPALVMLEDVRPAPGALSGDPPAVPAGKKLERLGEYRILREVGRGGMGVVYEAEQESLGRHVALKVLSEHRMLDPHHLQRFQREAKAAARLHHTNIVPVYGVGEADGLQYYVMQFIQGQGLDQVLGVLRRLRGGDTAPLPAEASAVAVANSLLTGVFAVPDTARPAGDGGASKADMTVTFSVSPPSSEVHLPGQPEGAALSDSGQPYWHSVARVGIQVAEALAYAHGQGTLHRDIKPSNLLLDTQGIVWVADFGLAKAADSEDLTQTGDVVGTLRYMAPERFHGRADPRSDVYALGLTLYELLTLRPAFDESDRSRLIHAVMHADPAPPRKLNPAVPRDLETIVLKATAREPAHRYAGAAELADDLRRFTEDKPIRARPVGDVEKAWRWARRNPAQALLAAACLLLLALGVAGVAWKGWEAELRRREAEAEKVRVQQAERDTAVQRDQAMRARNDSQRVLSGVMLDKGIGLAEQGEAGEGLFWMLEALRAAPEDAPELSRAIRTNLAAWPGQVHGLRQFVAQPHAVNACTVLADGTRFLTSSPDGVQSWDLATGRPLDTILKGQGSWVLSPDGKTFLTRTRPADGKPALVQRRDGTTGRAVGEPLPHPQALEAAAFSPDGKQLVTACADRTFRVWDAATGRLVRSIAHGKQAVRRLAISPDGRTLAAGCQDRPPFWAEEHLPGEAYLWDLTNGERVAGPLSHKGTVPCVVFSPDGKRVLTGSWDGTARLWDAASGAPHGSPLPHGGGVLSARFTPDGSAVVTGGNDGTVRWWDLSTHQPVGTLPLGKMPVLDLAFSPDGRALVAAGGHDEGGAVHVCEVARGLSRPAPGGTGSGARGSWVAYDIEWAWWRGHFATASPDAARVVVGGSNSARLIDTATGQPADLLSGGRDGPLRHSHPQVSVAAFSPDGRLFATSSQDERGRSEARLWETATGRQVGPPLPHVNSIAALAFGPDGRLLATGGYDRAVHLWDTATGARVGAPLPQVDIVVGLAFSPDGKSLAAAHTRDFSGKSGVAVWDVATRRQVWEAATGVESVLLFSPDGGRLLTAAGSAFRLWDAATGRPRPDPPAEPAHVRRAAFAPDGRTIVLGTADGTLRLRDGETGKPVGAPQLHPARVDALAFSPDPEGRLIVAGYADGTARLWDRATQKPLGPPTVQRGAVLLAAFAPDGRSFLTTTDAGDTRRWPVPMPTGDPPERLALRLEVRTGLTMGEGQTVVALRPDEWEQRRRQFGDPEGAALGDGDYHEGRARDAEEDGAAFTALWHLDRLIAAVPGEWLPYARRARCHSNAGRFDLAAADYDRALAAGSRDRLLSWYRYRVADCLAAKDWATALWYIDRLLPVAADDWRLYADRALVDEKLGRPKDQEADRDRAVERGADSAFLVALAEEYAARERWEKAAAAFLTAGERGRLALPEWHRCALACLKARDGAGYRRVCERLVAGVEAEPPVPVANVVAWVCAVGPDGLADYSRVLTLAEQSLSRAQTDEKADVLNTLGGVLYRSGRFREAVARLREGIEAGGGEGTVHDWALLALAHQRLGESGEARNYLAKLTRHKASDEDAPWDRLEVELLRREAEALLGR